MGFRYGVDKGVSCWVCTQQSDSLVRHAGCKLLSVGPLLTLTALTVCSHCRVCVVGVCLCVVGAWCRVWELVHSVMLSLITIVS